MMKNKDKSMKGYEDWEKADNMVKLLNALKDLSFSTLDIQYEYWTT